MHVSGPIVRPKAEKFSKLALTAFKPSKELLEKFKQRHYINYGKIKGEARSVNTNVTHDWMNRVWPKLKEKYDPSDIFNAHQFS